MSQQQQVNEMRKLISKFQPRIKRAFLNAIKHTKGQVKVAELIQALSRGNLTMAMAALNIESLEDFLWGRGIPVDEPIFSIELKLAYSAGISATMKTFPSSISSSMSFDVVNPNAIRFLDNYRMPLIREITNETREAVFETVQRSLLTAKTPRQQAKEIREVIGLTRSQAKAVSNFRGQLETRSNLGLRNPVMRRLSAVDRRIVANHMKNGILQQKSIDRMVGRYYDSLLNRRSLNIGRTESNRASAQGQLATWDQAQRENLLSSNARKKWIITPDERLRPSHRQIPSLNSSGRRINEPFQTPEGSTQAPPHGTNCRCTMALSRL